MSKIVVPEGMLDATVGHSYLDSDHDKAVAKHAVEAALRWLSENPPSPTEVQCNEMWRAADNNGDRYCQEWIRRVFLASEPEQSVSLRPGKYIVEVGGGLDPRVTPYEYAPVAVPDEFMECDSCRAKPGSPTLCAGCLHNRQAIENLQKASR